MSVSYEPPRTSPPTAQRYDSAPDTSLSRSDRSVRSMHSAPSLTNTGSTSFASSVLSTSTLNLNVHSIPLPNSQPHVHNADDDDKENLRAIHPPPPDITVTSPERPQLKRMQSERTVAGSLRLSAQGSTESGQDPHASWRVSEYGVLSDAYEDDENDNRTEEESISGSTDELGRALFYRPSTDPVQVRPESELDPELSAVLRSLSSTSLVTAPDVPAEPAPPPLTNEPEYDPALEPQREPEPRTTSPPTRPARPASLNLSDTNEPAPAPKTVDISARRRHSRMSSRDRLSMLLGIGASGSSPRTSLQGGRPSLSGTPSARTSLQGRPGHSHTQSHSSGHTIGSGSVSAAQKGKARLVDAPDEAAEEWVHVGSNGSATSSAIDLGARAGMSSAIELGRIGGATSTVDFGSGGIGTSSAIDLASSSRPRARTFSTHSRSRTISSYSRDEAVRETEFSQDAADMCRSVWEDDDTEEWGKGWGRVRKWLGEEVGAASTSTPAPKKRHVPKALSLASTINAFRTPSTITMSPLFGEGGLMGGLADKTMSSARRSPGPRDSLATPSAIGTPKTGTTASRATGTSRISFQSFFTAESKQTGTQRSFVPGTSTPTSAYVSLAVPASDRPSTSTSRHSSSFVSARSSSDSNEHGGPEPESPTITAKRFRFHGGGLEVPELPVKSSRELFAQPESSLGLELRHSTSLELSQSDHEHEDTTATIQALPSPPASPADAAPAPPRVPNTHIAPLSPAPRRPPIPRAFGSPKYASLHGRLGSPLRSGSTNEEGWAPMSPFMSPSSTSPQAAGPPSPGWSPVSPFPQSPLRTPASPLLSPSSFGAGPSSPLGMSMPMDHIYRTDVRPMSGLTESSYRPSTEKRGSVATSGAGWKRESDGTFIGRHSITNQPLLAPPPRMKTVRIVETGTGTSEVRVKPKRETGPMLPTPPPFVSTPVPRAGAIFKFRPGGSHMGPRMRVKRKEAVGAGFSPRAWFLMGFVLGPWCWMIGGWMTHHGVPMAALDVEKSGGRVFEGGQWVKRCRVASVVSGVVVFGGALVAVVWAVIGAR